MIKEIGIVLILTMLFTSGCAGLPLPRLGGSKPATKTSRSKDEVVHRITGYEEVAGKPKKYTYHYREFHKSSEKVVPKKTLMERVGGWISGLGFLAFILLVAGLFLAPTVTIGIVFNILKRTRRALKATVQAIKDVRADEEPKLHAALNKRHTKETTDVIGEIKAKL